MTQYWWSHWFWITPRSIHPPHLLHICLHLQLLCIFVFSYPHESLRNDRSSSSSVALDTQPFFGPQYPRSLPEDTASAHGPLSFPRLAEVSNVDDGDMDTDDVFNGRLRDRIAFREEWLDAALMVEKRRTLNGAPAVTPKMVETTTMAASTAASQTSSTSSSTSSVPTTAAEIITTRLSTKKSLRNRKLYGEQRMENVTRVNVTLIRSTTRSNKSASSTQLNTLASTDYSSNSSATHTSSNSSASSANSSEQSSGTRPNSPANHSDDRDVDETDEKRHNFTNDRPAVEVPPEVSAAAAADEQKPPIENASLAVRQSKRLLSSAPHPSEDEEDDKKGQDRERSVLEANLVNLTGGGSRLLVEMGSSRAMNLEQDDTESRALPVKRSAISDVGAIAGIGAAALALCGFVGAGGIFLYRRRFVNKPQTLSEPDSASGYIDDSINRDNSDEMYSLDNDSFLNSLEAMTIQNYWTESVKHTKL